MASAILLSAILIGMFMKKRRPSLAKTLTRYLQFDGAKLKYKL